MQESTDAPVDYDALDPGIREVVRRLNVCGFETCDSGDGKTKLEQGEFDPEVIPLPHVFMEVTPSMLVTAARLLRAVVESWGVSLGEDRMLGGVHIEATYDPVDDVGIIGLYNLDDGTLDHALRVRDTNRAKQGGPS